MDLLTLYCYGGVLLMVSSMLPGLFYFWSGVSKTAQRFVDGVVSPKSYYITRVSVVTIGVVVEIG